MNRLASIPAFWLVLLAFAPTVSHAQVFEAVDRYRSGEAMVTVETFAPAAGEKLPAILLLHASGGLDATADVFREMAHDLASQGYVVYFPHYFERTGHIAGRAAGRDMAAFNEAILDAVELAAANPIVDADRIGLLGYSMGSYLAFYRAGRDKRIKAIVSCSGHLPVESKSDFPPVLILQGSNDPGSPLASVKAFEELLKSKDIPYATHIYRRMGHNFEFSAWADASQRSALFFNRYLKGQEPRKKTKPAPAATAAAADGKPADGLVDALLAAHNRERKKEGHGPLKLSAELCAAAATHAKDMAAHKKLDHTGSDDSTFADRVKRTGYAYINIAENIAMGVAGVEPVMKIWLNSPVHRENIMADYTELGGVRVFDDEGNSYWCVNLGTPIPRLKPDEAAAGVVRKINQDRKAGKKPLLKIDPKLAKGAMAYTAAMAAKDTVKLEEDPLKLIGGQGARPREIRLQLSSNAFTPEDAAKALVGEDAKELDGFEEIGVGYAIAKSGTPYWCAIFSKTIIEKPRAVRLRERQDAIPKQER